MLCRVQKQVVRASIAEPGPFVRPSLSKASLGRKQTKSWAALAEQDGGGRETSHGKQNPAEKGCHLTSAPGVRLEHVGEELLQTCFRTLVNWRFLVEFGPSDVCNADAQYFCTHVGCLVLVCKESALVSSIKSNGPCLSQQYRHG